MRAAHLPVTKSWRALRLRVSHSQHPANARLSYEQTFAHAIKGSRGRLRQFQRPATAKRELPLGGALFQQPMGTRISLDERHLD